MNWLDNIRSSLWYIKLTNWEYWPAFLFNIPVVFIWLYFSLRAKSLFFFTRVNPNIETGGVFTESKSNIYSHLPSEYLPVTVHIPAEDASRGFILEKMDDLDIDFPVILKPDIGERGSRVEKILNERALSAYLAKGRFNVILQNFVDYPKEMSVVYHRFPGERSGKITSVCLKKALTVVGDGTHSLEMLIRNKPRARFQLNRLKQKGNIDFDRIPDKGEEVLLEPIGNHCRGAMFLDGNHHISPEMTAVFDQIHRQMDGMWYGRFDLKYQSIDDLKAGRKFCILEFNGISSEPAHIYDPAHSIWYAYSEIYKHWKIIYTLSRVQRARGVRNSMNVMDALNAFKVFFANKRALNGSQ